MVSILGLLAGIVTINVVGLYGRGEAEAFYTDERTIQMAVSAFYADAHGYPWNQANSTRIHNFPTCNGLASDLHPGPETTLDNGRVVREVWKSATETVPAGPASSDDITAAAIWIGLLSNTPGSGAPGGDKDTSSPLRYEHGPYLNPFPNSCSPMNISTGKGSYTWIVGNHGRVYGVFEDRGVWYAGFSGRFP